MQQVNIALELFAIAITLIILFCCIGGKIGSIQNVNLLIAMLVTNFFVLFSDLLTWLMKGHTEYTKLLYFFNFLVYSLGYVITALFTYYLILYIREKKYISLWIAHIIAILCTVAVLLVIVSLFNHMYFRFDQGMYVRGSLYWLSQVYPIGIILIDIIITIRHRKVLGPRDTMALLSYGIFPVLAMTIQILIYGITLLYIATTLSMLLIYAVLHIDQTARLNRKELELSQAKISIMLSQIKPHFLFNTLSSIAQLCERDTKQAQIAILELSQYLRGNLDSINQKKPLPFLNELKHIEVYTALEKMRFGNRLNIVYDISVTEFMIPSLTIQPLVENAVKHGICKKENGGTVKISTRQFPDYFEITISDDGMGFDPAHEKRDNQSHIGIENVKSRLAFLSNASLEIKSTEGNGTTAIVKIPKNTQ